MTDVLRTFGRYELLGLIARGGMGEVYLARFTGVAGFEKRCVIKKILPALAQNKTFVDKFLNEGKTLVALTHSNIVQIFDMGCENGEYYLAMEHIEGEDLRFLLRQMNQKQKHIRIDVACYIILEVLKGLSYAHRATSADGTPLGIIHRDISPSNLLISSDGEIKIIDFGIAKNEMRSHESTASMVQGKFAYMSPEQARGDALDPRTDLFSLGIVFYELLTGIRPFEGSSDLQSIERVKTQEAAPLNIYRQDIPEELSQIIAKALAKKRSDRFASADEFYDALDKFTLKFEKSVRARDVIAELSPFMKSDDSVVVNSSRDFFDAAFQEMLNAQAMSDQGDRTRSMCLSQTFTDELPKANVDDFAANKQLPPPHQNDASQIANADTLTQSKSENKTPDSMTPAIQAAFMTNQIESADLPIVTDENLVEITHRRHVKKIKSRILYILLGVLIACIGFYLLTQYGMSLIKNADNDNSKNIVSEIEKSQEDDIKTVQDALNIPEKPRHSSIHFKVNTTPDEAVINILEGSYSELNGKDISVIPDQNITFQITAALHETCIFTVKFTETIPQTEASHCESISMQYSDDFKHATATISLTKLSEVAPEPVIAFQPVPSSPLAPVPKAEKPVKTSKANSKRSKTNAPNEPAAEQAQEARISVRSNVAALLKIDGQDFSLPSDLVTKTTSVATIVPSAPSSKIGIPKKLTVGNATVINADFCEAKIHIGEFYVPGDPSPYQIANISIDGTRYVQNTDFATFVLPCGKHTFSANFVSDGVSLSASETTTLTPGTIFKTQLILK